MPTGVPAACLVSLSYPHRFLLVYSSFAVATIVFSVAGILVVAVALDIAGIPAVASAPVVVGILVLLMTQLLLAALLFLATLLVLLLSSFFLWIRLIVCSVGNVDDGLSVPVMVGVQAAASGVLLLESLLLLLPGFCRLPCFASFPALTVVRAVWLHRN